MQNAFKKREQVFQTEISIVLPIYFNQENIDSLTHQLRLYSQYDPKILDKIELVIVDDGSPIPVTIPDDLNFNVILARIKEDILWNSGGAKNLGAVLASGKKLIITDMDYLFPEHTLRYLLRHKLKPSKRVYKFYLKSKGGRIERSHPNTFYLDRSIFLSIYGYEEALCGQYGFDDTGLYRLLRYHGYPLLKFNKKYYKEDYLLDRESSYHSKARDLIHNRKIAEQIKKDIKTYGRTAGHSRKMLRFPWEIIKELERIPSQPPTNDSLWHRTWPARWLRNFLFSL